MPCFQKILNFRFLEIILNSIIYLLITITKFKFYKRTKVIHKNTCQGCNYVGRFENKKITKPLHNITVIFEVIPYLIKNCVFIILAFLQISLKSVHRWICNKDFSIKSGIIWPPMTFEVILHFNKKIHIFGIHIKFW